jgi:hypothetical protein
MIEKEASGLVWWGREKLITLLLLGRVLDAQTKKQEERTPSKPTDGIKRQTHRHARLCVCECHRSCFHFHWVWPLSRGHSSTITSWVRRRSHTMASDPFWNKRQQEWIKAAEEEERQEMELHQVRLVHLASESKKREDEMRAKPDPSSLTIVSDAFHAKMQREIGDDKEILGFKIVGKKGELFSLREPVRLVRPIMKHILKVNLQLEPYEYAEDEAGDLLNLVLGEQPIVKDEHLPVIQLRDNDVVIVLLDKSRPDVGFINETTEALLRSDKYRLTEKWIHETRARNTYCAAHDSRFLDLGFTTAVVMPPERARPLLRLFLHRTGGVLGDVIGFRVQFPIDASEHFAVYALGSLVKTVIFDYFGKKPGSNSEVPENERRHYKFTWAISFRPCPQINVNDLLIIIGRTENAEEVRRFKMRAEFFKKKTTQEEEEEEEEDGETLDDDSDSDPEPSAPSVSLE